jgi:hypothetical protein
MAASLQVLCQQEPSNKEGVKLSLSVIARCLAEGFVKVKLDDGRWEVS